MRFFTKRALRYVALFLIAISPFAYLMQYMILCEGRCTRTEELPPKPPASFEEQLRDLDSRYINELHVVFWENVQLRLSGKDLADNYTALYAEYQPKRLDLERALNIQRESEIERLLFLQKFIIDFANVPGSRSALQLDEGLQKYGDGITIGLKTDCLVPYPTGKELATMYYNAIHLNLRHCVIEAHRLPLPPPPLSFQDYRDKFRFKVFLGIMRLPYFVVVCFLVDFINRIDLYINLSIFVVFSKLKKQPEKN